MVKEPTLILISYPDTNKILPIVMQRQQISLFDRAISRFHHFRKVLNVLNLPVKEPPVTRSEILQYIFWYYLIARYTTPRLPNEKPAPRAAEELLDSTASFLARLWRLQRTAKTGSPALEVNERTATLSFDGNEAPNLIGRPDLEPANLHYFYSPRSFWQWTDRVLTRGTHLLERWHGKALNLAEELPPGTLDAVPLSLTHPGASGDDKRYANKLAQLLIPPGSMLPYRGVVFNGVHLGHVWIGIRQTADPLAIARMNRLERAAFLGAPVTSGIVEIDRHPRSVRHPYRVLVIGSKTLTAGRNHDIARSIGYALIAETPYTIITGGLKAYNGNENTIDNILINHGAATAIREHKQDARRRVLTMVPEKDEEGRSRFHIGELIPVARADTEARRAAMVAKADAIIAVEGGPGTYTMLCQAEDNHGKPTLPIPSTGTSRDSAVTKYWNRVAPVIRERFGASDDELRFLTDRSIAPQQVAKTVVHLLLRCLPRRAYISFPMDAKESPRLRHGVQEAGYDLLDEGAAADRLAARRDALRGSDVVIADTAHFDATVAFELGVAEMLGKQIVLVTTGKRLSSLPAHLERRQIVQFSREEAISEELARLLRSLSPLRKEEQ